MNVRNIYIWWRIDGENMVGLCLKGLHFPARSPTTPSLLMALHGQVPGHLTYQSSCLLHVPCLQFRYSWWRHQRYWPFVWGTHQSPVNSLHKGQWRGALMFSLSCAWTNGWVNNLGAGDLRRHRTHYDVIVMCCEWPLRKKQVHNLDYHRHEALTYQCWFGMGELHPQCERQNRLTWYDWFIVTLVYDLLVSETQLHNIVWLTHGSMLPASLIRECSHKGAVITGFVCNRRLC